MAALTPTVVANTPLAGKRILILTITPSSASDTVTLTLATHGVRTIYGVFGQITAGMDADFQALQISFSGLVITVVSKNAAGSAATDWTSGSIDLILVVD